MSLRKYRSLFYTRIFRNTWFRGLLIIASLGGLNWAACTSPNLQQFRDTLAEALPEISIIFALVAGLTVTILSHSVFGARGRLYEQARRVRNRASEISQAYASALDVAVQVFISKHVAPLERMTLDELATSKFKWDESLESDIAVVQDSQTRDRLLTLLLALEDEMNLLGIRFVETAVVDVHTTNLTRVYWLIAFAILVIIGSKTLPSSPFANLAVINFIGLVIVLALLELLRVLSFVLQVAREERAPI